MVAQLMRSEDPRDALMRATRDELVAFAQINNQADITEFLTKPQIVEMLRARGLTNIRIPDRPLGVPHMVTDYGILNDEPAPVIARAAPIAAIDPGQMSMTELRKACKAKGIKMARTDNLQTLRDKLRG